MKTVIDHPVQYEKIRNVTLNDEGKNIGCIVRWAAEGKLAYLSWRNKNHYFINHRGFGIDAALLNDMLIKDRIEIIVIQYKGPRGLRYYVSGIDDWVMNAVPVSHTKEKDGNISTYGKQMVLCEDYMTKLEVKYYAQKQA